MEYTRTSIGSSGSYFVYANAGGNTLVPYGYGPGFLETRNDIREDFCGTNSQVYQQVTLTRLHWSGADGKDLDLLDKATNGVAKPTGTTCLGGVISGTTSYFNRGREFVARDGSGVTFLADALGGISDDLTGSSQARAEFSGQNSYASATLGPALNAVSTWRLETYLSNIDIPATRTVVWKSGGYALEVFNIGAGRYSLRLIDTLASGAALWVSPGFTERSALIRLQRRPLPSNPSAAEYSMKVWSYNNLGVPFLAVNATPAGWVTSQPMAARNFSGSLTFGADENLSNNFKGAIEYARFYLSENNTDEAPAFFRNGQEQYSYELNGNLNDSSPNGWHVSQSAGINLGTASANSGTLFFSNGSRIHVFEGRPDWMADRNGNKITFFSESDVFQRNTRIVDPLGREVLIEYSNHPAHPDEDWIRYTGTAPRVLKLRYQFLSALLRDATDSVKTVKQLFPNFNYSNDPNDPISVVNSGQFNQKVPSEVELPNGQKYLFRYNSFGELARVTLPTGGRFEYDWLPYSGSNNGGEYGDFIIYRRVRERRVYDTSTNLTSINRYDAPAINAAAPDYVVTESELETASSELRRTTHTFHGRPVDSANILQFAYPKWNEGREYLTQVKDPANVPYRSVQTTWRQRDFVTNDSVIPAANAQPNDPRVFDVYTTLGALTSKLFYDYSVDEFNNVIKRCETDYGSSSSLRCTVWQYETATSYTALPVHLRGLVKNEQLLLGATEESSTNYTFDDYGSGPGTALAAGCPDSTNTNLTPRSPITQLESSRGPNFRCRGNVTRIMRSNGVQASPVSSMQYDVAGNVTAIFRETVKTGPAAGEFSTPLSTISYTDNPVVPVPTYAFPTTINHPGGFLTTQAQFHYGLGALQSFTDPNSKVTTYTYGENDNLDRLTKIVHPIGETRFEYAPALNKVTSKKSLDLANNLWITGESIFDGLGRSLKTIQWETYQNVDTLVSTETRYDALGRVRQVSNPSRSTPSDWTITAYDVLDRPLTVTYPDNQVMRFSYTNNEVLSRDPADKWTKKITDGLGRLKELVEDPAGTIDGSTNAAPLALSTLYTYNARDQLLTVAQGGRDRSFTYDNLGRLKTAVSPELGLLAQASGAITYEYDPAGNLIKRTDPRLATVEFYYDTLGRVMNKKYAGVATAEVNYCYDGLFCGPSGASFNLLGKLTRVTNSESTVDYSQYDALGRVTRSKQTVDIYGGNPFNYTYNDVALKSVTYPSLRTVAYGFDRAGRVTSVTGTPPGAATKTYVTAIDYAAHGAMEQMSVGAAGSRKERHCYNNRLQMVGMVLGEAPAADCASATNTLLRLLNQYGPTNNGNLTSQEIAGLAIQSFTYDKLNRLETATEGTTSVGWKQTFGYDRWGNRWVDSNPANSYGMNLSNVANGASWFTAKNQLNNVTFDAAGNQLQVAPYNLTYDGENRMAEAVNPAVPTTDFQSYRYDGNGRRVKKIVGTDTTYYLYDADGNLALEYDTRNPLPAQHCVTCYVAVDHLGSTRALWDDTGLKARFDYLPFGESVPADRSSRNILTCAPGVAACYNGPGGLTQKFTGKERDSETGLDYFGARYMSAAQGRFTSPDAPFADQDPYEPQSWNLYSYVRNNPLKFVDETGREIVYADRRLQIISDARRQQSTGYNSNLQGFEGPGSRTLTIQYGPTPNDPDGSPTSGLFSGKIAPAIMDCSPDCVVKTPTTLTGGTITVNEKLTGDPNQTSDTLAHEVSHANDARTNPQRFSTEKNTDANGKIIPHDSRPVEQRAINGANQSNQERRDFKKRNPEQNKQIDRQRDQQLKQENERRKREGQN